MKIPESIKQKIFPLNKGELKKLSIQSGNLEAFEALHHSGGYGPASKLLGYEEKFKEYQSEVLEKMATDPQAAVDLMDVYHQFLLAKICFPEDFDQVDWENQEEPEPEEKQPASAIISIDLAPAIKSKLFKLNFNQMKALAIQHNHLAAFEGLVKEENYALAVEHLGLQKEYQTYLAAVQQIPRTSPAKLSQVVEDFEHFLMAKICFPEDFDQLAQKNPAEPNIQTTINEPAEVETTPHAPTAIREKMSQLKLDDLEDLAIYNNNRDAFNALIKGKDFAVASNFLGLEEAYEAYLVSAQEAFDVSPERLSQEVERFEYFLLAKICFPQDF